MTGYLLDDDAAALRAVRASWTAPLVLTVVTAAFALRGHRVVPWPALEGLAYFWPFLLLGLQLSGSVVLARGVVVRDGVLTAPLLVGRRKVDLRDLRTVDARAADGRHGPATTLRLVDGQGTVRITDSSRDQVPPDDYAVLWEAVAADGVPVTARARRLLGLPDLPVDAAR